jgi:hypothetical protein
MATDGQNELFFALKAHEAALRIERDATSGAGRAVLDRRLEDTRRLLEWASAFVSPPSTLGTDQAQGPPSDRLADSSRR